MTGLDRKYPNRSRRVSSCQFRYLLKIYPCFNNEGRNNIQKPSSIIYFIEYMSFKKIISIYTESVEKIYYNVKLFICPIQ